MPLFARREWPDCRWRVIIIIVTVVNLILLKKIVATKAQNIILPGRE